MTPKEEWYQAIKELFRVCRVGIVFNGTTTDMTEEVIRDHELFAGLQTFWTFSEWSDAFVRNSFQLAVSNSVLLDEIWRIEQQADPDDWERACDIAFSASHSRASLSEPHRLSSHVEITGSLVQPSSVSASDVRVGSSTDLTDPKFDFGEGQVTGLARLLHANMPR